MKHKSKLDKLIALSVDASNSVSPLTKVRNRGRVSILCATIWLLAKHTRYEMDAKDIIMAIFPSFFTGEQTNNWG